MTTATGAENHNDKPCPSCGYCPTCGRRNASGWTYPYQTPYYPNYPWWQWQGVRYINCGPNSATNIGSTTTTGYMTTIN